MKVGLTWPVGCAVSMLANLLLVSTVSADLGKVRACTEVENDIARLQCFDQAVAELSGEVSAEDNGLQSITPETHEGESSSEESSLAETEEEPGSVGSAQTVSTPKGSKKYRPTRPQDVREADEKMVENCEFLGTVTGKSGWGGLAAGAASKGTMRSAKKKAAKLGATHVVFGHFSNGSGITLQTSNRQARAYRCQTAD